MVEVPPVRWRQAMSEMEVIIGELTGDMKYEVMAMIMGTMIETTATLLMVMDVMIAVLLS